MLETTKGPGDEITWPVDFTSGISVSDEDIQAVIAERVQFDPVGRDFDALMKLMEEESVLDSIEAQSAAIIYLTQRMNGPDFPPVLRASLTAAFTSIAEQTDVASELRRHRRAALIPD
jgi:hypothetical protein